MNDLPDHPAISNAECTGYPDGKEAHQPRCPICGEECETIYKDSSMDIVGCDVCVDTIDAWDVPGCFPGGNE